MMLKRLFHHALTQLQKFENIQLETFHLAEEVFEVASEGTNDHSGFNELQIVEEIPNLREVYLNKQKGLKYIRKKNQQMVLEFPKLTSVSINDCNNLEHVFTCSMVGSLVQLQHI